MKGISLHRSRLAYVAGTVSLLACAALPLRAMADTPAAPPASSQSQGQQKGPVMPQMQPNNNLMQLQQKYMAVRNELMQIATKAEQSDPALVKLREKFNQQLLGVMKKNGDDPQPMIDSYNGLVKQMQDKTLSAEQRKALLGKIQQVQMSFLAARQKAMQDPSVQAASKQLEDATVAAMRKVDANTDKLVGELHALETEILKARSGMAQ